MQGNNAGLCLCCGAPWPPIEGDVLDGDTLGNQVINKINKAYIRNEPMGKKFNNPKFGSPEHASHLLHQGHHKWAVQFMATRRAVRQSVLMGPPSDNDGAFPFVRTKRKTVVKELASWPAIDAGQRIDHGDLLATVAAVPDDRPHNIDWDLTMPCCTACNAVMTMEFWFRYHLYWTAEKNTGRLIQGSPITLRKAVTTGHPRIEESQNWNVGDPIAGTYPKDVHQKAEDIMGPAVAYYVGMCMPADWGAMAARPNQKTLYLYLCWIVMEVTCLVCEFVRGNRNNKHGKLLQVISCVCDMSLVYVWYVTCTWQSPKSHLGSIELYASFFAYTLLSYTRPRLREVIGFQQWHQQYFWFAWKCDALFPDERRERRLWAYQAIPLPCSGASTASDPCVQIIPTASDGMSSRELLEMISGRLVALLIPLTRLVDNLLGVGEVRPGVQKYFLPIGHLDAVLMLMSRGTVPDFDSFVCQARPASDSSARPASDS